MKQTHEENPAGTSSAPRWTGKRQEHVDSTDGIASRERARTCPQRSRKTKIHGVPRTARSRDPGNRPSGDDDFPDSADSSSKPRHQEPPPPATPTSVQLTPASCLGPSWTFGSPPPPTPPSIPCPRDQSIWVRDDTAHHPSGFYLLVLAGHDGFGRSGGQTGPPVMPLAGALRRERCQHSLLVLPATPGPRARARLQPVPDPSETQQAFLHGKPEAFGLGRLAGGWGGRGSSSGTEGDDMLDPEGLRALPHESHQPLDGTRNC